MRILVTGGTGQIGRPVVRELAAQGHDVTVLSRGTAAPAGAARMVTADLADADAVARAFSGSTPEALVHLAWEGLPHYSLDLCLRNLDQGARLFAAAAAAGCACLVSTGSCWEYASRMGQLDEQAPLGAGGYFPATKNALRAIGEIAAAKHGARFYWLRLFFAYGPGQRASSLVPQVVEALAAGRAPELRTPRNRHDFVHVDDIARAVAAVVARQPSPGAFNVGSGSARGVYEVADVIHRVLGKGTLPTWPDAAPEQDFWADITRLERETGWSPRHDIEDGIRATLRGMRG